MRPTHTEIVFQIEELPFTIPVRINKVSKDLETELNESCKDCMGDIGRKKYCKGCSKEIDLELLSTYRLGNDKIVINENSKELMGRKIGEQIQVVSNIAKTEMPIHLFKQTYWILPNGIPKVKKNIANALASRETFARFQRALSKANYGLIVKFCPSSRSRQKLGILTAYDKFMVIIEIPYNEQVNYPIDEEFDTSKLAISDDQVSTARQLIENLDPVDFSKIEDSYTSTLEKILENPNEQLAIVEEEQLAEVKEDPIKKLLELQIQAKTKKGVKKSQ